MHFLFIKPLFADRIIQTLCWMLVHSLWQGLLLAVVAGIIISSTKRSTAATRYNLLTGVFLLFMAVVVYTFCRQLNITGDTPKPISTQIASAPINGKNIPATGMELNERKATLTSSFVSFLNKHAAAIVFIWFFIMGMRSLRLVGGLYVIHQVKRKQLSSPGEYWSNRIRELSIGLGIHQRVRFLQSGIAKVPLVLGHFKPVILFPLGLLASIPPDEVEAILLHELAHIRRKDYLVNILQNFIETSFFFNPAVLWVSSLIKGERENCCDDIAVAKANNKKNYIRALISFQEFNMTRQPLVTALTGRKYHLLQRVKRIIYNNNKTLNAMEKFFLASGLVVTGLLALAFSPNLAKHPIHSKIAIDRYQAHPAGEKTLHLHNMKDTVPATSTAEDTVPARTNDKINEKRFNNIQTTVDGKRYEFVLRNDVVTELYIDGTRIPDDKIADHSAETKRIIQEAKENWTREMKLAKKAQDADLAKMKAEQVKQEVELLKLQAEASARQEADLARLKSEQSMSQTERTKQQAELEKLKMEQLLLQAQSSKQLAEQLKLEMDQSLKQETELSMLKTKELMMRAEEAKKQALRFRIEAETSMQLAKELELQAEKSMVQAKKSQLDIQATENNIINDLIREKVIKDKKNLSFTLNNEELIVNGVKQPEAVHKKLKEKYIKTPDWNFNYNNQGDGKQ